MSTATRRIPLDRRFCVVREGRIDVRPERGAIIGQFLGLAISVSLFVAVALLASQLSAVALAAMLVPGLILGPLSGMGLVYSLIGAHVVVDAAKQSVAFQQGVLGLGIGTVELVPFWKIERLEVCDLQLGDVEGEGAPPPLDLRGWDVVLVKTSGKELFIGQVLAANEPDLIDEGFDRALEIAEAVVELVGKKVVITAEIEESAGAPAVEPVEQRAGESAEGSP